MATMCGDLTCGQGSQDNRNLASGALSAQGKKREICPLGSVEKRKQASKSSDCPLATRGHISCLFRTMCIDAENIPGEHMGFCVMGVRRHTNKYPSKTSVSFIFAAAYIHTCSYTTAHAQIFPTF